MKFFKSLSLTMAALALAGAAQAADYAWTEGLRGTVVGTTHISDLGGDVDGPDSPPGFDLTQGATLLSGQTIDIYGRLGNVVDLYVIRSARRFKVEWIFEGYSYDIGGTIYTRTVSGLTSQPLLGPDEKLADIYLENAVGLPGAATGNTFQSEVTSGDPTIFGINETSPGLYTLRIVSDIFDDDANFGLYDIRITAVPLPAGGLLLLTALGGLGIARRRRAEK